MVAVRLQHYRRFERESTLDLTPRVVALIGPNEAGKSTVLDALENVTDPSANRAFALAEFSGRVAPPQPTVILSALFDLEQDDRGALADIPGAERIRLWHVWRLANGDRHAELVPAITRPRPLRDDLARDVERLLQHASPQLQAFLERELRDVQADDEEDNDESVEPDEEPRTLREATTEASTALSGEHESLDAGERSLLEEVADALDGASVVAPKYVQTLPARLRQLVAEHAQQRPYDSAFEILDQRCPRVRVLRDSDRQLQGEYRFDEHENPPAPLANLLGLAGVTWQALREAAAVPNNPRLATLLDRGNRQLEQHLHGTWKQATVSIRLQEQGGALNIYPYDADSDEHSQIADRSEGFRSFLALLAFTISHAAGARQLILAIDEAELHLHYQAQADLVKVLTEQTLATQIVYTTHSAGCLPEDLGSAIRVMRTTPGDRSVIDNGFWSTAGQPGLTSLLMAMGAGAMALSAARRAVIAEGPSDALLLPALFRAASGQSPDESLDFQIAGGLAWTPPRLYSRLEEQAARVVYLVDSDAEGERYRDDLDAAGVESDRILTLGDEGSQGLTVEDFVDKETYAAVVNERLIHIRQYAGEPLRADQLPDQGMVAAAESWTRAQGPEPLSKTAVAEHLLQVSGASLAYMYWDPGDDEPLPLLRADRQHEMARTYDRVRAGLAL
jgi:hypothetical protein